MPPKPRPIRKPSATAKDASGTPGAKDASTPSTSMPPPPVPLPPRGILEEEITALSTCFQQAVVKTGQVYAFYTDVKRLGIQKYAPHPPQTLTASLGHEVGRYDQLCDAIESRLLRAIAVLQRDLTREEQRIKAEEEAAAAAAPKLPSPTTSTAMVTTPPVSPSQSQTETLPDGTMRPKPSVPTPRRQSTISLSSLQRPAFPLKLDLSAAALRIHPDEMLPNGLSSPVTLAPRSARPSLGPDLMAALGDGRAVDIDLTVDPDISMGSNGESLDPSLGSSADKPIELDLDMEMQFFGDTSGGEAGAAHQNMFDTHSMVAGPSNGGHMKLKVEDGMDIDLLNALQSVAPSPSGEDIFASIGNGASPSGNTPAASGPGGSDSQKAPVAAPSPGAFLASLGAATSQPDASGSGSAGPSGQAGFDFDLNAGFFAEHPTGSEVDMMNMEDIFNMGVSADTNAAAGSSSAS